MNIFLQCITCGTRSRGDKASAPLVRQPYLRTQSLDRSFRRRRFRSVSSADWKPSLTAISEESSESSSRGDRTPQQQQPKPFVVLSEKMKRSGSGNGNGKSRVRNDSIDCRSIFAMSAPASFMF
ncbi:unnamed protein product [Rhodiola kirilowii]